jgi:hypothetical protein
MGPYVHDTLTRRWAEEEGLGDIAAEVGEADAMFDRKWPGRLLPFAHLHLGPMAALLGRVRLWRAIRRRSPRLLGYALHGIQDWHAHGYVGEKHWQHRLKLLKRHPDDWEAAPDELKARIEASTRAWLRLYKKGVGA